MIVDDLHPQDVARLRLEAWRAVSGWLDYAAAEFVSDAAYRADIEHVAECIRSESDRRYAAQAGFDPAIT